MSYRVILTLPKERVDALDALVARGAAASRNELVDKILAGFIKDLEKGGKGEKVSSPESALGALITFFLIILGAAAIAEILGGEG
jgi:hypothetical protein